MASVGYRWPQEIEERPLMQRMDEGGMAHFKDGSGVKVDVVIYCTGYVHSYPFLAEHLRLKSPNRYFPPGLYKGCLFLGHGHSESGRGGGTLGDGRRDGSGDGESSGGEGGTVSSGDGKNSKADDDVDVSVSGDKLFYIGAQKQNLYTITMFDQQGLWVRNVITGRIPLPNRQEMIENAAKWVEAEDLLPDVLSEIPFQTAYVKDLCRENDYPHDLDATSCCLKTFQDRGENILTYRDQSVKSIVTGKDAPKPQRRFLDNFDESLESFLWQTLESKDNIEIAATKTCAKANN